MLSTNGQQTSGQPANGQPADVTNMLAREFCGLQHMADAYVLAQEMLCVLQKHDDTVALTAVIKVLSVLRKKINMSVNAPPVVHCTETKTGDM